MSNPPYVRDDEFQSLQPEIRLHEPEVALRAGEDGLGFYRRIAIECRSHLKPDGSLILEVGQGQSRDVESILREQEAFDVEEVMKDYSRIERVIVAKHRSETIGAK